MRLPGARRYGGDGAVPSLPRDRDIVVYDSDPNELASSTVAADLIRQGYKAVTLKGGINEWMEAKLPIDTKEAPKQAPPEPGALKASPVFLAYPGSHGRALSVCPRSAGDAGDDSRRRRRTIALHERIRLRAIARSNPISTSSAD